MTKALRYFFLVGVILLGIFHTVNGLNGRIVGGETADIRDFPYQVSIIYIDTHVCGGSIIGAQYILTAGHCMSEFLSNVDDLMVRAGSSTVNEGGQVQFVESIHQHEKYVTGQYDFDLSILKLTEPLIFDTSVATIALPEQDSNIEAGQMAVASGWGRLYENGPTPLELQKVELPLLATSDCKTVYQSQITDRMFCAGYAGGKKDTCQGDSGGPLVANGVIIGIVSWGDGCAKMNSPGVYTQVSYFRNYLDQILQ